MKKKTIKSLGIIMLSALLLGGCGNKEQGAETTTAAKSENTEEADVTAVEDSKEDSEVTELVKPDFEALHYNTFIKNEAGEEVVGYQAPFGWNCQQLGNGAEYRRSDNLPDSIMITYIENATENLDTYKNLPDSLLETNQDSDDTTKQEKKLLGEWESPYGKGYLTMTTITSEFPDGTGGTSTSTSYDLGVVIPYGKDIIVVKSYKAAVVREYEYTCRPFIKINKAVPIRNVIDMYDVYHEMDIMHFVDAVNAYWNVCYDETNLKRIRKLAGLSQRELAELSGVSIRQLQLFEQRQRDINRTKAIDLVKLARVLGCKAEDLLQI